MDWLIVFTAEYLIYVVVLVALSIVALQLIRYRDYRLLAAVIVGGMISIALAKLGSLVVSHPQPFVAGGFKPLVSHEIDNSFPSDHTLLAVYAAYVVLKVNKRLGLLTLAFAILIGVARVIAGVHYWYDVLASVVFATAGFLIAHWIFNKLLRSGKNESDITR